MPIYRLLTDYGAFEPDDITRLVAAYEDALRVIGPIGHTDAIKEIVAKKIVDIAKTGERDPVRMRRLALKGLGIPLDE